MNDGQKTGGRPQTERPDAVPGVASVLILSALLDSLAEHQPELLAKVRETLEAASDHPLNYLHPAAARLADVMLQNAERRVPRE